MWQIMSRFLEAQGISAQMLGPFCSGWPLLAEVAHNCLLFLALTILSSF